jgi:hypothetical protein
VLRACSKCAAGTRKAGSPRPVPRLTAAATAGTCVGLEPSPPPEPLPEIESDDVHLVCWLATEP